MKSGHILERIPTEHLSPLDSLCGPHDPSPVFMTPVTRIPAGLRSLWAFQTARTAEQQSMTRVFPRHPVRVAPPHAHSACKAHLRLDPAPKDRAAAWARPQPRPLPAGGDACVNA